MSDHSPIDAIGLRDVIAAWLVCFAVGATGFAYAAVTPVPQDHALAARATPHPILATPQPEICHAGKSPSPVPLG